MNSRSPRSRHLPTPAIGSGEVDVMPLADLVERETHQPGGEDRFFVVEIAESGAPPRHVKVHESVDVGRQAHGIVLTDAEVSRRHLVLEPAGEDLALIDLGSTNGTKVNGRRVKGRVTLSVGDVIALGNTRLRVVGEDRGEMPSDPRGPAPPPLPDDSHRKRGGWFRRG